MTFAIHARLFTSHHSPSSAAISDAAIGAQALATVASCRARRLTLCPWSQRRVRPLTDDEIERGLAGYKWHQRWEIRPGVYTPGRNSVAELMNRCQLPASLEGRRVLDVGAYNACFSFECERRGAAEVVAVDLHDPSVTGVLALTELLESKVRYVRGSAYTLDPAQLGTFDLVLFLGVLYHLRYPLLAVDRLRTVAERDVYIESHLLTPRRLLRTNKWVSRLLSPGLGLVPSPLWRQYTPAELRDGDGSNVFGPTAVAVVDSFNSVGFETALTGRWKHGSRGAFRAQVKAPMPARVEREMPQL